MQREYGASWVVRAARYRAAVLACLFASACDSPVGPGSLSEHELLFVNTEVGGQGQDIFSMNSDGTGRKNLTNLSSVQYATFVLAITYRSLALSPDGRSVAFETIREGCPGIWGMNVDGSNVRKLSIGDFQATRCNYYPIWSPDGKYIAFETSREGKWSMYVMNADGTSPRNVAPSLDDGGGLFYPTGWSPDGRLVFSLYLPGTVKPQAYIVNPDGGNLQLLFGRTTDHSPEWSPDGSKVAFIRETDTGSSLFVMNADGSGIRRLTSHSGQDLFWTGYFPNDYDRWSPDGKRIVFTNEVGAQARLHVIDADGANLVRLTDYSADFNGWAPDGRITFNSPVGGSEDIYLINADGTGRVNLTNTPASHEIRGLWVKRQ